jgi:hypothetical protein
VASSDIARAVGIVSECPRRIINNTPQNPNVPTAYPNLRNRIAPKIVEIAVKKTGAVPNRLSSSWTLIRTIITEYPNLNFFTTTMQF